MVAGALDAVCLRLLERRPTKRLGMLQVRQTAQEGVSSRQGWIPRIGRQQGSI